MEIFKATKDFLKEHNVPLRAYVVLKANEKLDKFESELLPLVLEGDQENKNFQKLSTAEYLNFSGTKVKVYSNRREFSGYYHDELLFYRDTIKYALQEVPAREFKNRKQLEYIVYPATDTTIFALKALLGGIKHILFADEVSRNLFTTIISKSAIHSRLALMQAKFKQKKECPTFSEYIEAPEEIKLSDYQKVAIQMALDSEGLGLFMEQGTGKTCVCVCHANATAKIKRKTKNKCAVNLVVCPKNVVSNWSNEFDKFSTVKGVVIKVRGTADKRIALLAHGLKETKNPENGFVTFVYSYGSMARDAGMLAAIPFDNIYTDESHNYKSTTTERWKALKGLREVSGKRFALTGTPIANSIVDVYSQLEFLEKGRSGFNSLGSFKDFYINYADDNYNTPPGIKIIQGYKHIPFLQEKLAQTTFSISKQEAGLDLPEKAYMTVDIEPTKNQITAYVQLAEKLAAELDINGQSSSIEVNNALVKLLRLAQVCSGHLVLENSLGETKVTQLDPWTPDSAGEPNPKVSAVLNDILTPELDPNCKTVIWCSFIEDVKVISEALTRHKIEHRTFYGATSEKAREEAEHSFNEDPNMKVLVANPAAAGEGMNFLGYNYNETDKEKQLPTYCGQMMFFSQDWSMIKRKQAEDRGHRRGLRKELGHQLRIIDYVIPGTVDEMIRERVKFKKRNADIIGDISQVLSDALKADFTQF